jgi:hypothetical protein
MNEKSTLFDHINDHVCVTGSDAGSVLMQDDVDKLHLGWSNGFGDGSNVIYISNGDFSTKAEAKIPEILRVGLEAIADPLEAEYAEKVGLLHIRNPRATWLSAYDCTGWMQNPIYTNLRRGTYIVLNTLGLAMETRVPELAWQNWTISCIIARISPAILRETTICSDLRVLEWNVPRDEE